MPTNDSVTLWLNQVKEGERAGVRLLLERYFQRLVRLARSRFQGRPGLAGYAEDDLNWRRQTWRHAARRPASANRV